MQAVRQFIQRLLGTRPTSDTASRPDTTSAATVPTPAADQTDGLAPDEVEKEDVEERP